MICAKLNAILLQVFFVCIFARQQDSTPLLIQLILEYLDGCYATMYMMTPPRASTLMMKWGKKQNWKESAELLRLPAAEK